MERVHERGVVLELAVELLESLLEEQRRRVGPCRVEPRHHFVFVAHGLHETLVVGRIDRRRVPARRHDTERLVPHILEHAFVDACRIAEHRNLGLQSIFAELA